MCALKTDRKFYKEKKKAIGAIVVAKRSERAWNFLAACGLVHPERGQERMGRVRAEGSDKK